ncbi:hypothetical protein FX985_00615 [Pseudomonas extremaustralis]|uniref:DnaT DNA-binding domain-containing protein n=1 Tax=Pseudomonas extremaustralis TaxID=359110 RepID=A0A5M9IYH0_9PSED|nr:hypothetical protein [Pseudomonas extremaustralis]KAA8560565.1 hypothetical protein FX985_00615 [Pseudomonas extremaustralis]
MDWFRMYGEFATDPKVQMMSEAMQRRLVMLFCLECSNGIETFHVTERATSIAFALRVSDEVLAETKVVFLAKGFINDDWTLRNWSTRQYESDSSTARVKAWRDKKKQQAQQGETLQKRSSNAQEQNRTDTEQNKNPLNPPAAENEKPDADPEPLAGPKPKRKSRLPEPFNLTGDMRKWAIERAPAVNLVNETEKFVNYWRGSGGTKADWPATWRTWFLKAQEDANRRLNGPQRTGNPPLDMASTDWALEPIL